MKDSSLSAENTRSGEDRTQEIDWEIQVILFIYQERRHGAFILWFFILLDLCFHR
jgi:hypothetical protein